MNIPAWRTMNSDTRSSMESSMPRDVFRDCWFLTGVTAVGKTEIGIELARQLRAEIISLDSMAVYRGMDIGTAKPTLAEQAKVPHHLIDVVDLDQQYSIAQYLESAGRKVGEIRDRRHEVLFVGGSPLYLKGLLRGLFDGPPANWEIRTQIQQEVAAHAGDPQCQTLHARLESIDPVAASQIHPNDTRRLIRALEVYRETGQPISHQQLQFDEGRPANQCRVFVLRRPRDEQRRRIHDRVDAMLTLGLVDEVRRLTQGGKRLGRTASQAVGYREVIDYLVGHIGEESLAEKIKSRTRRFAKRQRTWFRSLSECRYVDIEGEANIGRIAGQIVKAESGELKLPAPSD